MSIALITLIIVFWLLLGLSVALVFGAAASLVSRPGADDPPPMPVGAILTGIVAVCGSLGWFIWSAL